MFNRISKGLWWDRAWTLTRGCTPVSEGCDNCWAAREAHIRRNHPNIKMQLNYSGLTDAAGKWNGKVRTVGANLDLPLRVKKPTAWAVWNDLFHEDMPDELIDQAFITMISASKHRYIILTKRPQRMHHYFADYFSVKQRQKFLKPNVWLGVTVENQEQANMRIPLLLDIPAAIRFVSVEPMLSSVKIDDIYINETRRKIDWVICGGETGSGARPCQPEWVRKLRDDCQEARTPFFFKKWGQGGAERGRLLDGREWNEIPG